MTISDGDGEIDQMARKTRWPGGLQDADNNNNNDNRVDNRTAATTTQ
jgi:hypothetical protein